MKIKDDAILNQVYDGITFDAHERVPFFIVDADSIITVEATEDTEGYTINVVDNYYTETLDGVIYAKMGSTHKNKDGSFSGAEPTYSSTVEAQWSELGAAISSQSMMEIRKVAAMNAEEYREYQRDLLETESKPKSFQFECEFEGVAIAYNISDSDRIDFLSQMTMLESGLISQLEIHDVKRIKDYCTIEEATQIMIALATVTKTHKYPYDAKIKALYQLPDGFTKGNVDDVVAIN